MLLMIKNIIDKKNIIILSVKLINMSLNIEMMFATVICSGATIGPIYQIIYGGLNFEFPNI